MHEIGKEEIAAVTKVIEGKQFMRYRGGEGGYTENFEKDVREAFGVKHALTMNSGTSALICAMVGLGLGPGDEVIVPAYTWIASAMAPLMAGAVPVLAEIDETLMIDPDDIERKITEHTKAIIPVHMSNRVCDMDRIMTIADKHGLKVCEDACQAVGLTYKKRRVATIGQVGAFSYNQYKNITCGEGGMILTDDDLVYERALMLHDTGCFTRDHASAMSQPFFPGFNFRVSEILGAIMSVQFKRLDPIINGLLERKKLVVEILREAKEFELSPENDPDSPAVTAIFKTEEAAIAHQEKHGGNRFIDSGRHVYSNWEPLLNKSFHHPALNPHSFAKREIDYTKDMCPRTLDILKRTRNVGGFAYDTPLAEVEAKAKTLIEHS